MHKGNGPTLLMKYQNHQCDKNITAQIHKMIYHKKILYQTHLVLVKILHKFQLLNHPLLQHQLLTFQLQIYCRT